ncbi:MAG: GNAT family N-acetyltransferase [Ignavibacteria bacterium]|nr:GNAT family N-acetyltransferase [Ignavibacteria bacterium]
MIKVSSNIKLELIRKSHAKELFALTDSNRKYLRKWLPWVDGNVSVNETMAFIIRSIRQNKRNDGFNCAVLYKGKISGVIGLTEISRFNNRTEIGYWLGEEFTGKGIMTKSCKALADYCFKKLKVNRIIIRCEVNNKKSRMIPERLGFFKQGILKHDGIRNGRYLNLVQYSVYKNEWK